MIPFVNLLLPLVFFLPSLALRSFLPSLALRALPSNLEAVLPPCRVGQHLERAGALNYPATIDAVDAAKGTYHVKYDNSTSTEWLSERYIRRGCVPAPAAPIAETFFIGNWEMFVGPAPQTVVIGNERWLEVGPGAVAPPLSIKADGTYVWYIDRSKVINGRWRKMTSAEMKYGYKDKVGILLMNGYDGANWQVTSSGVKASDNRDQLDVQRLDLGLDFLATRMRDKAR